MKDEKRAKAKDKGRTVFHSSFILHHSSLFRCVNRSQHRTRLIHRLLKLGGGI